MIELPFIPGFLISLLIIILIIRAYTNLANRIGEGIRMFFYKYMEKIKKYITDYIHIFCIINIIYFVLQIKFIVI